MFPHVPDRWAIIVRVSHMGNRRTGSADFHSEREQIEAAKAAVAGAGGIPHLLPSELDVSGGLPLDRRPSLKAAVEGVEQGVYAGIVVAYQSRLTRDPEVEEQVWRRVEAAGGTILMALDPVDNTTVDGRLLRRVRSSFNAAERERHVVRFDDLRRKTTKAGIWQRRQLPTGYAKNPDTRRLTPGDRADDVRWAFRARAAGTPILRIAERLGMTTSGVRYMLRNRVYLGELKVGEYVNTQAHPPLVTPEEFDAAQLTVPRPARSDAPEVALLAGIIRCAGCGHVLSRQRTRALVYSCHVMHSGVRCPEPASIVCHAVDAHVERVALAELERLDIEASRDRGAVDTARTALDAAQRELTAFLDAVSADDVGPEAFAKAARKRRDAVDDAKAEVARQMALSPAAPGYGAAVEAWHDLPAHDRNLLLRALLEGVVVRKVGKGKRVPVTDRVRVIAHGAGVLPEMPNRGEVPFGIVPLPFPDGDAPGVLGVPVTEDAF